MSNNQRITLATAIAMATEKIPESLDSNNQDYLDTATILEEEYGITSSPSEEVFARSKGISLPPAPIIIVDRRLDDTVVVLEKLKHKKTKNSFVPPKMGRVSSKPMGKANSKSRNFKK